MKFPKQDLQELLDGIDVEGYTVVVEAQWVRDSRWESVNWLVFLPDVLVHGGKIYAAEYRRGLTEMQESFPFDDDPDEIECRQVHPRTVTTVVYE